MFTKVMKIFTNLIEMRTIVTPRPEFCIAVSIATVLFASVVNSKHGASVAVYPISRAITGRKIATCYR